MSLKVLIAKSFEEVLFRVNEADRILSERARDAGVETSQLLYRGCSRETFELTPSLLRYTNGLTHETDLYEHFKRLYLSRHGRDILGGWDLLFRMQHYNVPTRLLDWTSDLNVALFFALNPDNLKHPSIFLLEPSLLNKRAIGTDDLILISGSSSEYPTDYYPSKPKHEKPFAFQPDYGNNNDRLRQQRGMFTIHGFNTSPIEVQYSDCLVKVVLRAPSSGIKRNRLMQAELIFPDEEGTSMMLRERYGLKYLHEQRMQTQLTRIWEHDRAILVGNRQGTLHCAPISGSMLDDKFINRDETNDLRKWLDSDDKHLVVVNGGAGSGKTNLLVNFVDSIFNSKEWRRRPVLYFSLSGFSPDRRSLMQALGDYLDVCQQNEEIVQEPITAGELEDIVSSGQILLVLDGLDELVRTKGDVSAGALTDELFRLMKTGQPTKIIVACRDHIMRRLFKAFRESDPNRETILDDVRSVISLNVLTDNDNEVRMRFPATAEITGPAYRAILKTPLLLKVLSKITPGGGEIKLESASDLWRLYMGLKEDEILGLGLIAVKMLTKRDDYLGIAELEENLDTVRELTKRQFPLFAEEAGDKWRFLHQAIREYVLARSMRDSLTGTERLADNVLTRTSSFDYESAEAFLFLSNMLEEGGPPNGLVPIALNFNSSRDSMNREQWNNYLLSFLQIIGMVKVDHTCLPRAVERAYDILMSEPETGVLFHTRFEAARCLERLHSTAPDDYAKFITNYRWKPDPDTQYDIRMFVEGYAVRGFNLRERRVDSSPPLVFMKNKQDETTVENTGTIIDGLTHVVEHLAPDEEIAEDAEFLRVNCSYALIRWLEYSTNPQKDLVFKLAKNNDPVYARCPVLDKVTKANLFLALECQGYSYGDEKYRDLFVRKKADGAPDTLAIKIDEIAKTVGPGH